MQRKDFAGEIVKDLAFVALHADDILEEAAPQVVGGQEDAGDPAFGTLRQLFGLLRPKLYAIVPVHEFLNLGGAKAQLCDAQAGHFLTGDQTGHRQFRGQGAAGEDDVAVLGQMAKQGVHKDIDFRALVHQMIIIEDQDKIAGDILINIRGDGAHQGLDVQGKTRVLQNLLGAFAEIGELLADGKDDIVKEDAKIAVSLVESQPADGQVGVVGVIHEHRGLAISRPRRDEDQLAVDVLVDEIHETRAAHQ